MDYCLEGEQIVRQMYGLVDRLRSRCPQRRFTLDGHFVGCLGEVVGAARYNLTLLASSAPLHDALATDGRGVQLKVTQSNRIAFRGTKPPDHLIVLSLKRDGSLIEEYNGPGLPAWEAAGKRQTNGQRPLSLTTLRRLMAEVPPDDRLPQATR